MFSEKEYIKAIGIISCYLNCDEMSTEEFNDSIVVINDLINEYFEIIEEKERLEKELDKACDVIVELNDCTNLSSEKYGHCPFEKKCNNGLWHDQNCISNKENWKELLMKDE